MEKLTNNTNNLNSSKRYPKSFQDVTEIVFNKTDEEIVKARLCGFIKNGETDWETDCNIFEYAYKLGCMNTLKAIKDMFENGIKDILTM